MLKVDISVIGSRSVPMKVLLDPLARTKLERLCDSKWPEEVGGELLGHRMNGQIIILDIFPIPNVSPTPRTNYKPYEAAKYFVPLVAKAAGLTRVGTFHSHPNGTIPSEKDMQGCPGFHLWVLHQRMGFHTFIAAQNYTHVQLEVLNEQYSIRKCMFRGDRFFLGDLWITEAGQILGDEETLTLLKAPPKSRLAYLTAVKLLGHSKRLELKKIAIALGVSVRTVRNWLRPLSNIIELGRGYLYLRRR